MQRLGDVLQAATVKAVARLGPEAERLWALASLPSSASLATKWTQLQERRELAEAQRQALEELADKYGDGHRKLFRLQHDLACRQLAEEIAANEATQAQVAERDAIEASRPAGCFCLGLGGRGHILRLRPTVLWSEWCPCPDGQQLEAEAAAQDAAEEARVAVIEAERLAAEATAEYRKRLQAAYIPRHFQECTFASFPIEPSKRAVVKRLQALAAGPWHQRGVFLHGECGVGKTGLSVATLLAWLEAGRGGLFIVAADWLESMRPGGSRDSDTPRASITMDRVTRVPLLVVDDLGVEHLKTWGRERLHMLISARHDAELPTIYTSNYDLDTTAARLAGFAPSDDPGDESKVDAQRGGWRIVESCDVIELRGRNLRAPEVQ